MQPLYGLNNAGRKFWFKVEEVFEETGMMSSKGDEPFYCHNNMDGYFVGMISSHMDNLCKQKRRNF